MRSAVVVCLDFEKYCLRLPKDNIVKSVGSLYTLSHRKRTRMFVFLLFVFFFPLPF